MEKTRLLFLGLLLILLQGCATLRGMAEDIQNLGRGLKNAISEEDESRRQTRFVFYGSTILLPPTIATTPVIVLRDSPVLPNQHWL
jgi:predicted small secreted protein